MKENYDVIVVGAGPAGIMTCYELYLKNPELEVLLIDKGHDVMNRHCPIKDKKIKQCPVHKDREPGCIPACSITDGFGGAGAYSDGKFNITSEFGGWLTDYLNNDEVEDVIHYVDNLYLKHGATKEITDPTTDKVKEIEHRGYAVGLKLLRAKVRHLGTEENLRIMTEMSNELKQHMDLQFKTSVQDILVEDHHATGIVLENGQTIHAKKVVLAGCSNGGYMTLLMGLTYPQEYDAIVPICEAVPDSYITDEQLQGVKDLPMYFIYSKDDDTVDPTLHEIPTINRLKALGASNLHVSTTEHVVDTSGLYKDENYSGHWSWIYFFNNEAQCDECGVKSFDWIDQQLKKSEVPVTDNKKAENNPSQAVKTGDTAHGEIYAMIMMFASAGYVFFKQRKEA